MKRKKVTALLLTMSLTTLSAATAITGCGAFANTEQDSSAVEEQQDKTAEKKDVDNEKEATEREENETKDASEKDANPETAANSKHEEKAADDEVSSSIKQKFQIAYAVENAGINKGTVNKPSIEPPNKDDDFIPSVPVAPGVGEKPENPVSPTMPDDSNDTETKPSEDEGMITDEDQPESPDTDENDDGTTDPGEDTTDEPTDPDNDMGDPGHTDEDEETDGSDAPDVDEEPDTDKDPENPGTDDGDDKPVEPETPDTEGDSDGEVECDHSWVDHTTTIEVEEKGHYEEIIVKPAWTETIEHPEEYHMNYIEHPEEYHYEQNWIYQCNGCKEEFDSYDEVRAHNKEQMLAGNFACGGHSSFMDDVKVVDKEAWTEEVKVVDKEAWTEYIEHEAEYDTVWVVDEEAHTETIVDGQVCENCGEWKYQ